ncbi:dihydrolipoyl dehydrogenase [Sedimentibacter hydroxybenzoicus DSM 7310]|uniref:Dihydrolipoyl dehydrogenase n=1 Tax=Sedimentibacter hydroxybenzoicus DSM 7310 TaxID=1123245 RepID=A0A974GV60_SEDHY|nr:dihydrolipoyl dehydrogenase [Sedimentibacter hydroxybenzoicus]NYB72760.1 dihydrolipoyl dehydrogenase [Sedimentibacter hydroxybenzoicus DSM 7310]
MPTNFKYDIIIIGGGPGGYPAAIYAAKNNARVAIIEKEELGGTCLNKGCIPTKTFIKSAGLYNDIKSSQQFGITTEGVSFKWDKILNNKNKVVRGLTNGVQTLLKSNGIDIYKGKGKLIDNNTVKIEGNNNEIITGANIVIATGSKPATIPVKGSDLGGVITSDEALDLENLPESLAIIGGGVIGVELGYVFRTFGVDVTIIEMLPEILPRQDADAIKVVKDSLQKIGIKILTETKLLGIEKAGEMLKVNFDTKNGQDSIIAENVLISAGRKSEIDVINGLSIVTDKQGIVVDEYMRTNISNIYAIGDVTGKVMLAHVATHQALVAVKNILGKEIKMNYNVIPSCIYTNPELASVGLTEEEAKINYKSVKVGLFPFAASGKAKTIGETDGFVKIICDEKYNEILGVHIVGDHATELIAEACLAIKMECTAEELADTIHAHPTLSEAVMEASEAVTGFAIHNL